MKKIAVAQMDEVLISKHFGRSPYFGIYTISDKGVEGPEMRINTFTHHAKRTHDERHEHHEHGHQHHNHGHHSVVEGLKDCQVLIAGGMGMGAKNSLSTAGVEVIITDNNLAEEAVRQYQNGSLQNLDTSCN
jgi:predicted Fe-Mo cluster-binding NifX family protein